LLRKLPSRIASDFHRHEIPALYLAVAAKFYPIVLTASLPGAEEEWFDVV
jgi:hypothetical protein